MRPIQNDQGGQSRSSLLVTAIAFAAPIWAVPAVAVAAEMGRITQSVVLHHVDPAPKTMPAARRLLVRISNAAMEVCGASEFSAPAMRQAVKYSDCYRHSMRDTVARIGSPVLSLAYSEKKDAEALSMK